MLIARKNVTFSQWIVGTKVVARASVTTVGFIKTISCGEIGMKRIIPSLNTRNDSTHAVTILCHYRDCHYHMELLHFVNGKYFSEIDTWPGP